MAEDTRDALSVEVLVTRGALLEVGMPHLAAAVNERRRKGVPYPTFAGSGLTFNGGLSEAEEDAARRAFTLGHRVHNAAASFDVDGIDCACCG